MAATYQFNMFLPEHRDISQQIPQWIASLKQANPALFKEYSDEKAFMMNAAKSTMDWFRKSRQKGLPRYQTYGPYWFSYKKILKELGFLPDTMKYERPELEAIYCGRNHAETVAAAYLFMLMFLKTFFVDTKRLQLDENQLETIDLTDPDMEQWLTEG